MAKIVSVDYEAIPRQAMEMRNHGKDLNNELSTAYKSIESMHKSWYGKRYNSLVQEFNKITNEVNELLQLVVGDIPFTLETVANNYAQADKGSTVTRAVKEAPKKIATISEPNDVGMKFMTSEVADTQKSVSKNFKNAKNKMDIIESSYERINWQSEAAQAFKAKFKKLKNDIVNSFDDIDMKFTKLMEQTKDDIQSTENANTVK